MHGTDPVDRTALADLAETAARRAMAFLADVDREAVEVAGTKSSTTDLVTTTDRAVEELLIATIAAARPDDAVLAEETGTRGGTSGVTWIIDPIDGTTNFVYGLAGYNVAIAAAVDGRVEVGVVADPVRDEVFRAIRGAGATCNGHPLAAVGPSGLSHALIGTGFAYSAERRRAQAAVLAHLLGRVRDVRRLGAAALDLCYVAAGRLDGYYESGLQPWDLAAGGLIAVEAGCRVTGVGGDPPDGRLVIAAHPGVVDALTAALAEAADDGLEVAEPSARPGWKFGRLVV